MDFQFLFPVYAYTINLKAISCKFCKSLALRSNNYSSNLKMTSTAADGIIKEGYMVKSPPLNGIKNKAKRWCRRWFVLYDTTKLDEKTHKKEIALYYFENKESFEKGIKQKGKLYKFCSLVRAYSAINQHFFLDYKNSMIRSCIRCMN